MTLLWSQKQHFGCYSRNNRAMKKDATQEDWVKRTARFPPDLFTELAAAAKRNGHSWNDEVVARSRIDQLAQLRKEIAELKTMVREVLDQVRK
jgi:hypothetical protein